MLRVLLVVMAVVVASLSSSEDAGTLFGMV
jgi:hypothetical protein